MAKKNNKNVILLITGILAIGTLLATTKNGSNWIDNLKNDNSSLKSSNSNNDIDNNSSIIIDDKISDINNINYEACLNATALDGGSGAVLSSGYNNMWISYYISVDSNATIEFSSEPYKVCYYTSDKTFIKQDKFITSDTMTKTYTIPDNASYIRFQYCSDSSYDVPAVSFDNRTNISISYVE